MSKNKTKETDNGTPWRADSGTGRPANNGSASARDAATGKQISFEIDGQACRASAGESIWDVAKRLGTVLPHLCHADQPGYRPDGNCRACMVEIDGERTLGASCIRAPQDGMIVRTASARATKARRMVMELLRADRAVGEDAIFVPFAYREAPANILTNDALDPYGKIPEFKYAAVHAAPVIPSP